MDLEPTPLVTRSIWTFVWFTIVSVGTNAWWTWSSWSGFSIIAPLITLIGLIGLALVWTLPMTRMRVFAHVSFVASLCAVALTTAPVLATTKFFITDSAAFNQLATQLFLKGHNPYSATFRASMLLLHHPASSWTYTLNGGHVDQVSYPAGSFLLLAPFQILGIHHLGADWVDLLAWLLAAVILYVVSPSHIKWLSPLLLLSSLFTFTFAHGGTDSLFIPFMMIAALRWDAFVVLANSRWSRWIGPIALGVACSLKQTPWFTVPFFIVGIAIEAERHDVPIVKTTLRYLGLIVAPFAAFNLPFIVWSPREWLHGTFLPLTQPLVPDGQGLVTLATHGFARVVHTRNLQIAGFLLLLALLIAFFVWYPVFKRIWLLVLPIVLFVPSRSLSSYLVDFVPAALIAVITTQQVVHRPGVTPRRPLQVAAVFTPVFVAVVFITLAFSSPVLTVKVDRYSATAHGQFIGPLILTLTNTSSATVSPHVMVVVGSSHPDGFWTTPQTNNFMIKPHATVTTTFLPPKFTWAPKQYENWLVEVMTSSPAALSTSPAFSWPYTSP